MANRSNRRRQNPRMSEAIKAEEAMGSWRANSPSWPGIDKSMRQLEADGMDSRPPKGATLWISTVRRSHHEHSNDRP